MRVIFLHHAGGEKYAWRRYKESLSTDIEQVYLELPGRGDRYGERLLYDTDSIVDDLYNQIIPHLQEPYIMVGKSMGALHSYLLLHRMTQNNQQLPIHVFLGSRQSPDRTHDSLAISDLPSKEFWEGVKRYGGVPKLLLENKELLDMYEPILRADFASLERYQYVPSPKLEVASTIMVGKEDIVKLEDVTPWSNMFSKDTATHELNGGHFFMYEQAYTIGKMIEEKFYQYSYDKQSLPHIDIKGLM
ncbi:MAG TPA: alpha/beta fold hydrolase [Chitinophagales bacterium]|nr:alpha/beta fold hydrolase [Chitinophagales bacterium]